MKKKVLKGVSISFAAFVITALGLLASDDIVALKGNVLALTGESTSVCPAGMTVIAFEGRALCVDIYEASPSHDCVYHNPASAQQSEANLRTPNCFAVSVPDAMPWRFVTLAQAQRLCSAGGKRIPTSGEWYRFALGTLGAENMSQEAEQNTACVTDSTEPDKTGHTRCVSSVGVYDAVGNLWEWTSEEVQGNTFHGRTLPRSGYVSGVDSSGVAASTSDTPQTIYGNDYFWSNDDISVTNEATAGTSEKEIPTTLSGVLRGGFYGSGSDAGMYAVQAALPISLATAGVGFRCVKDI